MNFEKGKKLEGRKGTTLENMEETIWRKTSPLVHQADGKLMPQWKAAAKDENHLRLESKLDFNFQRTKMSWAQPYARHDSFNVRPPQQSKYHDLCS